MLFTGFLPAQESWHNMAGFPGTGRDDGVGAVCNGKAYFGTGFGTGFFYLNDWWEYDFDAATWTPKTALPGQPRDYEGITVINNDIYILGGYSSTGCTDEMWVYHTRSDQWELCTHFPAGPRQAPLLQALNGKLYAGMGRCDTLYYSDIWEFDPQAFTWKELTSFPGGPRYDPVQAVVNEQLLIGAGVTRTEGKKDCYEYSPLTGNWKQVQDFPGCSNFYTVQVSNGNVLYLVNGSDFGYHICDDAFTYTSGWFEEKWTALNWAPIPFKRRGGVGLLHNNKLYYVSGLDTQYNHLSDMLTINLPAAAEPENVSEALLYPNPASDYILLETREVYAISSLRLWDPLFREMPLHVQQISAQYFRIDVSQLPAGMYMLHLMDGSKRGWDKKFIKY